MGEGDAGARKTELRVRAKAALGGMSEDERAKASARAVEHLVESDLWRLSRDLLAYLALPSELSVDGLWAEELRPDLWAPLVAAEGRSMTAVRVESVEGLPAGRFGVRTPEDDGDRMRPGGFGVVLVPGLAFDRYGGRLGRGAGFYDAWLGEHAGPRTEVVGVCFESQLVGCVPMELHDATMTMILTEAGLRPVGRA